MEGKREQDWAEGEGGWTRSLGGLSWPHGECWCLELSPSGVKAGQAYPPSQSVDEGNPRRGCDVVEGRFLQRRPAPEG